MNTGKHPLIQYNNKTVDKIHSLILCIGREPNNIGEIGNHIQPYYFKKDDSMDDVAKRRVVTRCSFWNVSHGVIAHFDNKEAFQFKYMVNKWKCSPLIYADALSKAIPNEIRDKEKLRNHYSDEQFQRQAEKIFSNELIARTRLVMLSGLSHKRYNVFKEKVAELAKQSSPEILVIDVPFFYGTNKSKIIEMIESKPEIEKVIKEVLVSWKNGRKIEN